MPAGDDFRGRKRGRVYRKHRPDVFDEADIQPFLRGDRWERRIFATQLFAVFVSPAGEKGFGVVVQAEGFAAFAGRGAKAVLAVDVLDAGDRGEFEARLAGGFVKRKRPRCDDGM